MRERPVRTRLVIWSLLAVPALLMLLTHADLMELTANSGTVAAHLITLALAITPLHQLARGAAWAKTLLFHRRAIGVAAFAYALLHVVVYLMDAGLETASAELALPAIWTGWFSFFILLGVATISNDKSQRWLGPRWKHLQRFAYVAALLGLIHWLLVHDSQILALAHAALLLLLIIIRVVFSGKKQAHD